MLDFHDIRIAANEAARTRSDAVQELVMQIFCSAEINGHDTSKDPEVAAEVALDTLLPTVDGLDGDTAIDYVSEYNTPEWGLDAIAAEARGIIVDAIKGKRATRTCDVDGLIYEQVVDQSRKITELKKSIATTAEETAKKVSFMASIIESHEEAKKEYEEAIKALCAKITALEEDEVGRQQQQADAAIEDAYARHLEDQFTVF